MAQSPEQKKSYKIVKQFKGLNTKAHRTAIDESELAWIENVMPVGYGNMKVVGNSSVVTLSNAANVVWSNTVTHLDSASINNNDLILRLSKTVVRNMPI
jgi:hypothetical protein